MPYLFIFLFFGLLKSAVVMLALFCTALFSAYLSKVNYRSLSSFILIGGVSSILFVYSILLGQAAGAPLIFFPMVALPVVLYESTQRMLIFTGCMIPVVYRFLLEVIQHTRPEFLIKYGESVSKNAVSIIYEVAIGTAFLFTFYFVYHYFLEAAASKKSLQTALLQQKLNNDKLLTAYTDLEKSNALINSLAHKATLGALIRGIVHEVKGPLTAIRACCSLILMEDNLTTSVKVRVNNMLAYIKNLGELVRTLLADSGSVMWMESSLDVGGVVDQILRLADNEGFVRNIHFEKSIPSDLPAVKGSPAYISQALLNLLLNALRFSPDGSQIRVAVKVEDPWVNIYVSDSGPGINPDIKDTLFKQGTTTATPGDSNLGLGLYFVKRVMDAHNGIVAVHDSSERGTTFVMGLPIWKEPVSG